MVEKHKIKRIDKSKGLSYFVSNLMGILFTSEEMATSSITGGSSNFQKNKEAAPMKKQLNPLVKDSLIGNFNIYSIKYFQYI